MAISEKRKARLKEITKLKLEITELGGKLEITKQDLDVVEKMKYDMKFEQSGLKAIPTKVLSIKQKARLNYLNKVIPKIEVKLRLDRNNLKFKESNKLVGNVRSGFSVKKIGNSKVTLFN